jgi:UDP-N-acetylglucosamine:LPS N-acetylglucosamine transferase
MSPDSSQVFGSLKSADTRDTLKRKILFAMIEAGGGHKSPALAVREALRRHSGERYEILFADFMKETGCDSLDQHHKESWNYLLDHPILCKTGHRFADFAGPVFRTGIKLYLMPFYDCVRTFLLEKQPDLVFSTHYFNTMAIDLVRRWYKIPVTLVNYHTELFDTSSLWVLKGVDYYLVSSEEARRKLIMRGIPKRKLLNFNYPVRSEFFEITASRESIALHEGADSGKMTVLMSFGGQGFGNIGKFIQSLIDEDLPLNIIVVAGRNEELRTRLEQQFGGRRGAQNVLVKGFVSNMHELMHLADLCFIKPGPSTTMEAVALRKPLLFYKSAQLSENGNISFALRHGIGFYVGDNHRRFQQVVAEAVRGSLLEDVAARYRTFEIRNGAADIARFLVNILESEGRPALDR